jgi:cysteine desulfurase / selenocysteine lyase
MSMSINTTNTSNRLGADSLTSSPAQEHQQDAQQYESASPFVTAVPDAAVIAKLANEFFAALPLAPLPQETAPEELASGADLPAIPGVAPQAAMPGYPREMFSFSGVPNVPAVPSLPRPPLSPPAAALNEADFRAIAASLAGATSFAPQITSGAPPPAIPGSSSAFPDGEKADPWSTAPQLAPNTEMYSFPAVPAMPSSPPTAPPSGSDISAIPNSLLAATSVAPGLPIPPTTYRQPGRSGDQERTDPWALAPNFPTQSEVFSFPRVPGASVPGIPQVETSQPSLPASQPVLGTIPPASLVAAPVNAPNSLPSLSNDVASSAIAPVPDDSENAGKTAYGVAAPNLPSASHMFSFPGVPGAQSPPGVPVMPSSVPTDLSAESDIGALPAASTGIPSQVTGVLLPAAPGWPRNVPDADAPAPRNNSLPQGVESFEFRPDLAPAALGTAKRPLDPRLIRQDFPILQERVHGRQLIWLDNAATTQKPNAVIDRLSYFYRHENSNIHRAAHTLAARATDAYESAREKSRRFLNASSTREIIFVRGTTEGINLIAQSWGRRNVQKDDEIVITWLEHHANIVPWQQLCSEKGARLRVAPVNDRGEVILEEYEKLLSARTKIVSFSQVSNALGTVTPAREMIEIAHRYGARVLLDGAQAVSHMAVDVQTLDCDFYVFSGHKVFGPTGIGVVYGKLDLLDTMPPWQGGGNMIADVTFEKTTYQSAPARFEAGTGNIADAVGLGAALDYVEEIGRESIAAYEHELLIYATAGLLTVPGLRLIGTAREKAGVLSFVLDDIRTEDVGAALNQEGIAVRSGHHCAQPILRRMGVETSVRPSLAFYNTCEEIDTLVMTLLRLQAGRGHRKL